MGRASARTALSCRPEAVRSGRNRSRRTRQEPWCRLGLPHALLARHGARLRGTCCIGVAAGRHEGRILILQRECLPLSWSRRRLEERHRLPASFPAEPGVHREASRFRDAGGAKFIDDRLDKDWILGDSFATATEICNSSWEFFLGISSKILQRNWKYDLLLKQLLFYDAAELS